MTSFQCSAPLPYDFLNPGQVWVPGYRAGYAATTSAMRPGQNITRTHLVIYGDMRDVDSVARLESFRALKLTLLENFRARKLLKPYWRFLGPKSSHNWRVLGPNYSPFWRLLGPYPPKTLLEIFRVLKLTLLESIRALKSKNPIGDF